MARLARKQLADMRAMEEQDERENPISGSGATPSMGLSQFRGGKKAKAAAAPSDAFQQGAHLGQHLHSLHGAGFWDDFGKGFMSVIKPAVGIASMLPGPVGTAARVGSMFLGNGASGGAETGRYEGEGKRRKMKGAGHIVGAGKAKKEKEAESCSEDEGEIEGAGIISDLGIPIVSGIAGMFGLGKEKKAKRVVGAGDGRRKRAEVVKKVMKEKGLSMIEASKYVKAHGLY